MLQSFTAKEKVHSSGKFKHSFGDLITFSVTSALLPGSGNRFGVPKLMGKFEAATRM
jgi:hypothetical protein